MTNRMTEPPYCLLDERDGCIDPRFCEHKPQGAASLDLPEYGVPFEDCPFCGDPRRVSMSKDWQRQVNEEGAAIPIIGCGNPWHYIGVEGAAPRAEEPACSNCGARSWSYEGRDEPICEECGHAMPTPGIGAASGTEGLAHPNACPTCGHITINDTALYEALDREPND